ncbi:MAG TPA: isoprenylcysteine carboxylmethyltransferase family protein [Chitinophagaceae bacterium]|jgi:protein-S-isoprenylcysteine O-methyltransferase Ste14|nr:isoprenylcysteine carboxylmethyltransferase family protein [Chitinophagaceae bacterium]
MNEWPRWLLPLYFLLYFLCAFVWTGIRTARRIGKSPVVLPSGDDVPALIGRYFKGVLLLLFLYTVLYALLPAADSVFLPVTWLRHPWLQAAGAGLLGAALLWTVAAQGSLRDSWRIGIDTETPAPLVTSGLFRRSRNPVFLGMIAGLLGLFLLTPNAVTALLLVTGYMLIQVQIRLEEAFLEAQHGNVYQAYCRQVKRFF